MIKRILGGTVRRAMKPFGFELARTDTFGKDPLADVRKLRGPAARIIFDAGANEGQTALRLRQFFTDATVHCFEPGAAAFRVLQKKLGQDPGFRLVRKALGEVLGTATLYENASSVTNSLLPNAPGADVYQPPGSNTPTGQTQVEVETIDNYCARHDLGMIDLLKIDSQGFELKILRGAEERLRAVGISCILLEVLFDELYSGQSFFPELYAFLRGHKYRLVGLYEITRGEDAHISWCDALFIAPRDARAAP